MTSILVPPLCSSCSLPFSLPFFSLVTRGDPLEQEEEDLAAVREEEEDCEFEGEAVKEECSRKEDRADKGRRVELIFEGARGC